MLAQASGGELDGAGRITVGPDLTLPGHPEVIALGDVARVRGIDGAVAPLPGLAPVAIQQGRYAGMLIGRRLRGRRTQAFRDRDKGNLATIGRSRAVAEIKSVRLVGVPAWVVWLLAHIFYLIGFPNRTLVLMRWSVTFLTRGRGARLIRADVTRERAAAASSEPTPPRETPRGNTVAAHTVEGNHVLL